MRITTAWKMGKHDDTPYLVSAYDEMTEDEHGGEPPFYGEEIAANTDPNDEVREVVIVVPSDAIFGLFGTPAIVGDVEDIIEVTRDRAQ